MPVIYRPGVTASIDDHLNDTSGAHAASAISADSTTLVGVGTDVQAVLEELDDSVAAVTGSTAALGAAGGTISLFGATAAVRQNIDSAASAANIVAALISAGLLTNCTAVTTGTAVAGGVLESEIVTGGQTIILTLTGGTWAASGATFDAQRQAIINGLTAAEAEAGGWNATVKPAMVVTNVVRTSASIVTITLPAVAGYQITVNENVTPTIPTAALADVYEAVVAAPNVVVTQGA